MKSNKIFLVSIQLQIFHIALVAPYDVEKDEICLLLQISLKILTNAFFAHVAKHALGKISRNQIIPGLQILATELQIFPCFSFKV